MGGRVSASGSFRSVPCANANADWMSALCPRLWDVPLHHLSIPGSHDTMTYCLNKKSPVSHSESRLLQLLSKVVPCVTRPVVLRWSVTQALDITEQLDAGVRYLDLRIAHMLEGSEKNLHFVHMVYTTALVEDTLTEISEWLEQHPREVVILACRNFEGMTEDLHEYLVACIKNIFGDMLCPRGELPTLRQLWARGQQVLLSYEDEAAVRRHPELWPGIPYWWGNKVKSEALIRYLEDMKSCGRPGRGPALPPGPTEGTVKGAAWPASLTLVVSRRGPVRGRHQPHRGPGVRAGAPGGVPEAGDPVQPVRAQRLGPRAEPGARRPLHQHHRRRLRGRRQLRRRRHRAQPEAAVGLTVPSGQLEAARGAALTQAGPALLQIPREDVLRAPDPARTRPPSSRSREKTSIPGTCLWSGMTTGWVQRVGPGQSRPRVGPTEVPWSAMDVLRGMAITMGPADLSVVNDDNWDGSSGCALVSCDHGMAPTNVPVVNHDCWDGPVGAPWSAMTVEMCPVLCSGQP
uniref:PI-PLC X domain-containing protein 1 isoform X1 n=1 Tax=Ictidomys tridecemlineatus TaxID=43179 RepID=UPI000B5439F5|nr:PI-PLC X domain-containing protein 1 isoform X1 [Ictidomys tridecemlineatus]